MRSEHAAGWSLLLSGKPLGDNNLVDMTGV
jgi:hypothetical protein